MHSHSDKALSRLPVTTENGNVAARPFSTRWQKAYTFLGAHFEVLAYYCLFYFTRSAVRSFADGVAL
jgi:hypothetical protein